MLQCILHVVIYANVCVSKHSKMFQDVLSVAIYVYVYVKTF